MRALRAHTEERAGDLAATFIGPLPAAAAELPGVPAADLDRVHAWREAVLRHGTTEAEAEPVKGEIAAFLTRFPALTLAVAPERLAWRRGTVNRGPVALPVTW